MHRSILAAILTLSMVSVSRADAQQGGSSVAQTEPVESSVVITTLPNQSAAGQGYTHANQGYLHGDLEEANRGIRNTRNALIATSAVALVGVIVASTAASQCDVIYRFNRPDDLVCTQRGDALIAAGASIFGLAAIGVITSGIMLGVRKGKRRRLNREIRSQQGARLQWDIESGRVEF